MVLNQALVIRDRRQAGWLLADALMHFRNSNAVVIGIPYGGAVVGYHLAKRLNLSFDVIACKAILHPADERKTIGSVTADQAVIHDDAYDIPRDYVYHQIVLRQNALRSQQAFYHSAKTEIISIADAKVIVVGDIVKSADSLIASIRTLYHQKPKELILAASLVTPDVARQLASEVDEIVSLFTEDDVPPGGFYEEDAIIRDEDIRDLVSKSFSK